MIGVAQPGPGGKIEHCGIGVVTRDQVGVLIGQRDDRDIRDGHLQRPGIGRGVGIPRFHEEPVGDSVNQHLVGGVRGHERIGRKRLADLQLARRGQHTLHRKLIEIREALARTQNEWDTAHMIGAGHTVREQQLVGGKLEIQIGQTAQERGIRFVFVPDDGNSAAKVFEKRAKHGGEDIAGLGIIDIGGNLQESVNLRGVIAVGIDGDISDAKRRPGDIVAAQPVTGKVVISHGYWAGDIIGDDARLDHQIRGIGEEIDRRPRDQIGRTVGRGIVVIRKIEIQPMPRRFRVRAELRD